MLTKVDELLKLLLNSSLVLPLYAIHTLCTIDSNYKMINYFPLDLGKFRLSIFDLILIVLGHLIKGQ